MSRRTRKLGAAFAGLALIASSAASAGAQGAPEGDPPGFARAEAALARLGNQLPAAAQASGMTVAQYRSVVLNDPSVAVNQDGEIAYFDEIAPGEVDTTGEAISAAPPTTDAVFQLSSLPGAEKTIYLDFDGHITEGTTWNASYDVATIVSPPFDIDGDPNSWSAQELDIIRRSFIAVSEDFAPWNVNVTTIDPGADALSRTSSDDVRWGARVVITDDTFANCGCGGHAFIGSFDDAVDEPTYVYNSSFVGVSEAITHEVGHMLNLSHDGTADAGYYTGHDGLDGHATTGWAPIMGAAYYQPLTQWSQQEYIGANNNNADANFGYGRDDVGIISSLSNGNGFGLKADDVGDTANAATALVGSTPSVDGLISHRGDIDAFSFTTIGGDITIDAAPDSSLSNLDIALTLRNADGVIVAESSPLSTLAASIATTVPAGTYVVEVDGIGVGNPASFAAGYTDYGSLGRYVLTASIGETAPPPPPDTEAPAVPSGVAAEVADGVVVVNWIANTESDLGTYNIYRSEDGGPRTAIAAVAADSNVFSDTPPASGDYTYWVTAVDVSGNESDFSASVTVSLEASLTSVAVSDFAVYGTVQGNYTNTQVADGVSQAITEASSGGKPNRRHDRLEHHWAIPATTGPQTLTVVARVVDGGDADNGVSVQWSTDQTNWIPLGTIAPGAMTTQSYSIGAATGTVWVRIVDTNRDGRQQSFDRVEVDQLRLDGSEAGQATQTLLSSFTVGTESAGKGTQRGTATVVVRDDLGQTVPGATVSVTITGSFNETLTGTTDSSGAVSFTTTDAIRKPSFQVCVTTIDAALPYNGGTSCRSK